MTKLTLAPTVPTISETCAPKRMRENKSRPCTSVPNQCCNEGAAKTLSVRVLGSYWMAKALPCGPEWLVTDKIIGQAITAKTRNNKNHALITAGRLLRNRRHAF